MSSPIRDLDRLAAVLSRVPQPGDPQGTPVEVQIIDTKTGLPVLSLRPADAACLGEWLSIKAMLAFRAGQRG